MGVLRLGYVHMRVTDLEEAKRHYGYTMGLMPAREEPGRAFYKGWDEWDHHSVVLEEGGVGLVKDGLQGGPGRRPGDLREARPAVRLPRRADEQGRQPRGRRRRPDRPAVRARHGALQRDDPRGHRCRQRQPRGLPAASERRRRTPRRPPAAVDLGTSTSSTASSTRCWTSTRSSASRPPSRRTPTTSPPGLSTGMRPHDIAFLEGLQGKIHHFAFGLKDWSEILHAGQI